MGFFDFIGDALGGVGDFIGGIPIVGDIVEAVGPALGPLAQVAFPGVGTILSTVLSGVGGATRAAGGARGAAGGGGLPPGLLQGAMAGLSASQIADALREANADRSTAREMTTESVQRAIDAAQFQSDEYAAGDPLRQEFRSAALNFFDPTNPFSRGGPITDIAQQVGGVGQGMDDVSQRVWGGGITPSGRSPIAQAVQAAVQSAPAPTATSAPPPRRPVMGPTGGSSGRGDAVGRALRRDVGVHESESETGEVGVIQREAERIRNNFGPMVVV